MSYLIHWQIQANSWKDFFEVFNCSTRGLLSIWSKRWLPLKTMNYSWVPKKQGGPNKWGGEGGMGGGLEH